MSTDEVDELRTQVVELQDAIKLKNEQLDEYALQDSVNRGTYQQGLAARDLEIRELRAARKNLRSQLDADVEGYHQKNTLIVRLELKVKKQADALETIAFMGTDCAAAADECSFYRSQLGNCIGTAARLRAALAAKGGE